MCILYDFLSLTDLYVSLMTPIARQSANLDCYVYHFPCRLLSLLLQHNHLIALQTHLNQIRKPYLSLSSAPPLSRRHPRSSTFASSRSISPDDDVDETYSRWEGMTFLTDRERDEIDLRARMILRRCRERVMILEHGEKGETAPNSLQTSRNHTH